MSLTIQEIITEADTLVPSGYTDAAQSPWPEAVAWLNAINQEFFDVVKIPKPASFTTIGGTKTYTLSTTIKEKNIDRVLVGHLKYRSLNYEDVQPGQNWFTFDENTKLLSLSSAPSRNGEVGILRFYLSANTSFTTSGVATQVPDAPDEYHWIYVLGLAEYIAKANEEDEKVLNYGGQYRAALATAASNYKGGAPNA